MDVKQLRIAFHTDNGIVAPEKAVSEAVQVAVQALAAEGARVEEARPPGIEQTYEIYFDLFTADGGAGIESLLKDAGTNKVHPLMQQVLDLQRANGKSMSEFGALIGRWDAFRRDMLSFMQNFDAIVCPVCAFAGMVHGSTYRQLPAFSYTMTYNLTGWPGAVVRAGISPSGLPVGVQVVAAPWREDIALAVAQFIENSLGGWQRPPI